MRRVEPVVEEEQPEPVVVNPVMVEPPLAGGLGSARPGANSGNPTPTFAPAPDEAPAQPDDEE